MTELSEQHRDRLYGIVALMESNNEDSTAIQTYVNDYKTKYSGVPDTSAVLKAEDIPGAKELQLPQGSTLGGFVAGVGQLIDYYGGAPVRNAIYKAMTAPDEKSRTWEGMKGFLEQYGRMPSEAPTGKDLAKEMGVEAYKGPTGLSHADVVGFLTDIGADWTNIIPGKAVGKLLFKPVPGLKKVPSLGAMGAKTADVITGTTIPSTVGKSWIETAKTGKRALQEGFGAKPIDTWESSREIAKRLNIPEEQLPASVKYGKNSLMSLFERFEREGPLGQKLRDAYESGTKKLERGITGEIESFGVPRNMAEAGAQMQGAFDKGTKKFFKGIDVSYDKVLKANPDLNLSEKQFLALKGKLTNYMKATLEDVDHPIAQIKSQANEIAETLGRMDFSNQTADYWRGLQKDIGNIAFTTKYSMASIPPDIKKFRQIYFDIEGALQNTFKSELKGGQKIVNNLKANNKKMTAMYKDKESLANLLGKDVATEKKFAQVMGDTRRIKALKTFVEPEDLNKLKASYLENQIVQRAEDGAVRWQGMAARVRAAERKGVLNALFDSGELGAFRNYVRLADRFGEDVLSRSGTGASNQFIEYLKTTVGKIGEEITVKPIREIATGGPSKVAKTLPLFRTPKEYLKSPAARMKGIQVYSVQREAMQRDEEKKIIGDYYDVNLSDAPYKVVDNLIKKTRGFNEMKEGKMKNLYGREIEGILERYGGK